MPVIRLTEKAVDRIPFIYDGDPVEYYDSKISGFGVRAGFKSKTYFVKGRSRGKQFKRKIGKVGLISFDEALQAATNILKDVEQGMSPDQREAKEVEADSITLRTVLKEYLAIRKNLKPGTVKLYQDSLNCYLSDWLDAPMRTITPAMVVLRHFEVGQKSPAMSDGTFRIVRALYNYAMDAYEDEITRNPIKRLSSVKAWYRVPRKQSFVNPSQLPVFFKAIRNYPGLVADYLEALLFTGIRSGSELAWLQTAHVDQAERTISLFDTKTKKYLVVPVSDSALQIFGRRSEEAKAHGTPYLFSCFYRKLTSGELVRKKGDRLIRDEIRRIFADTPLKNLTPHDLRRTFLSYADELEISNVAQKRLVGHAIPTDVTDGYKVLTMERLHREVAKVEAYILKHRGAILK